MEVATFECLERPYEVKKVQFVKQSVTKDNQHHNNGVEYFVKSSTAVEQPPRQEEEAMEENNAEALVIAEAEDSAEQLVDADGKGDGVVDEAEDTEGPEAKQTKKSVKAGSRRGKPPPPGETRSCAVPSVRIPGHTGYLTFATFLGRDKVQPTENNGQKE